MVQKRFASEKRKMVVAIGVSLLVIVLVSFLVVFYQEKAVRGKVVVGRAAGACEEPPSSVVGWWAFDESSGTTADNLVEAGEAGTMPATVTFTTEGNVGNALEFPGGDQDFVTVPDSNALDITNALTLEAWVFPTKIDGQQIIRKQTGTNNGYNLVLTMTGKVKFIINDVSLTSAENYQPNQWQHLVATYGEACTDNDLICYNFMKMYINGVKDSNDYGLGEGAPSSIGTNNEPLKIGGGVDGQGFEGKIDEVTIYNSALSVTKIAAIYESDSFGKCKPGGDGDDVGMETVCNNGADDASDTDTLSDCNDPDCNTDFACGGQVETDCADNADNDGDGDIDCADSNCATAAACLSAVEEMLCADGEDNDNDNLIDCFDPDCGTDNDNSGEINCFDSSCYNDQQCQGESCGFNKVITWSYKLPDEGTALAQGTAPARVGCCAENQCAVSATDPEDCQNAISLSEENALTDYLCEQEQNWLECGEENEGAMSSDSLYECVESSDADNNVEWETICQPTTKYALRSTTGSEATKEELCDGQQWQQADCATFNAYPTIVDPTVEIKCLTATNSWTVKELACNNNRDDDNDGKTDRNDKPDCNDPIQYILGKNPGQWYEVAVKSTDDYKMTIKTG